jgi:hypothetical protein
VSLISDLVLIFYHPSPGNKTFGAIRPEAEAWNAFDHERGKV